MPTDAGGPETEHRPSILKKLADKLNQALPETPELDMAGGPVRKSAQSSQIGSVGIPQGVEDRLRQIGSETFGYTPDQLELAKANKYDLSTVEGKAGFASFLGRYYTPKETPAQQPEKHVYRVATHSDKFQFTTVDNTGKTNPGH